MTVSRIVPYARAESVEKSRDFYADVLGLDIGHEDLPRIAVLGSVSAEGSPEAILLTHEIAGPEVPIPLMLIEVDDVDQALERAVAGGHPIVYPLTDEWWGVRRFFVEDPSGAVINVLQNVDTPPRE
jgi:predicted enzyme related to lactoylglutathione lyase